MGTSGSVEYYEQPKYEWTVNGMDAVGRFSLSIILSFLSEEEGTSLLITKKHFATKILPIFRVKGSAHELLTTNKRQQENRHRFAVFPVQDPSVLIDRLNTRRLYKRKRRPTPGFSTSELAAIEWQPANHISDTASVQAQLCRFIDKKSELQNHVATILVSYPRSGNTLLRSLLERTTGIVTGSDTRPDRSLSRELAEVHHMVGEGVIHPSQVAFVKTHWPERTGLGAFLAKRAVLVVRNPYDAIDSYWNLNATKTHTKTVTDEVYQRFSGKFERLVRNEIGVWMRFHDYWIHQGARSIPVLVVRYEDLVQDPSSQLRRILNFSLERGNIDERMSFIWERRIQCATAMSTSRLGAYLPRSSAKSSLPLIFGKSILKGRYSTELLEYIQETTRSAPLNHVESFGYSIDNIENPKLGDFSTPVLSPPQCFEMAGPCGLKVNVGKEHLVRPMTCEFGRLMQQWRHSVTNNDNDPLPTV